MTIANPSSEYFRTQAWGQRLFEEDSWDSFMAEHKGIEVEWVTLHAQISCARDVATAWLLSFIKHNVKVNYLFDHIDNVHLTIK